MLMMVPCVPHDHPLCSQDYKNAPRKVLAHTALSDIRESIEELKYYRRAIFKQTGGGKK
jgi:oligoribonuclease (3'-5' exoribonuclease)